MFKKSILIILALLVFIYPITNTQVDAAVAGKVINVGAKKVAKEVIQDITWNMATEMVINYKYTPKSTEKPAKQGFELVCLPADRNENGNCGRILELKKDMTSADKSVISSKVETVLEKKITGGAGLNKWTKFLDWLLPISTVLMGATLIDYLIDGDVAGLFDEVALETLIESGLIEAQTDENAEIAFPGGFEFEYGTGPHRITLTYPSCSNCIVLHKNGKKQTVNSFWVEITQGTLTYKFNGTTYRDNSQLLPDDNVAYDKIMDKVYEMSTREKISFFKPALSRASISYSKEGGQILTKPAPNTVPQFDETGLGSNFVPSQNVPIVNPNALPMTETGTDIQVVPEMQPDGSIIYRKIRIDETTGTTTKGDPIDEGNITVKDPKKIITPTGDEVVENPNFDPTVNPAPGTVPEPTPDPNPNPNPTDPPVEEPGGTIPNSCEKGLKKPDFKPLTTAFTTSFPFSIPWDLKRLFNSAFSEIGADKPEFDYKFNFNGQEKSWKITVPAYFDSWLSFTKPLLLIIFDIGLIYAIYRFTKGGD